MKLPALVLMAILFQYNWGAESLVPPVKDGFYNNTDLDGLTTSLRVSTEKNDVSWIAYDWSHFTETPSTALLLLYVKEVRSPGTLEVSLLEKTPTSENNAKDLDFGTPPIATIALEKSQEETLVALDITDEVTGGSFRGVVLTAGGSLDASFGSKESSNRPLIMVRSTVSGGPTGPAGGALSGSYPDPTLAAGSVGSDELEDGSVTNNKINGVDYSKVANHPTSYAPTAHDHDGDALAPNSLVTASLQAGNTNAPKIGMMTWTFQTPTGSASILPLDGSIDPSHEECPYPENIIHLSGILNADDERIPPGTEGTGSDYWDVKYEDNAGNDNLLLQHRSTKTQGQQVTVFAIYRIPE